MKKLIFVSLFLLLAINPAFGQRGRERYNSLGRYSAGGSYRDGYAPAPAVGTDAFGLTATLDGYANTVSAFEDLLYISVDDVLVDTIDRSDDTVSDVNLVLYYPATENVAALGTITDQSGQGNNGTLVGDTRTVSTEQGLSLELDGTGDYVDVADAPELSFGNGSVDGPFTISAWVYMRDATKFRAVEKIADDVSGPAEWSLGFDSDDKLRLTIFDLNILPTSRIDEISDIAYTSLEGQFAHILGVYDGQGVTGLDLYINGNAIASSTVDGGSYVAMENTVAPVVIGASLVADDTFSNGQIGSTRIYGRALSPTEIGKLYAQGANSASVLLTEGQELSLVYSAIESSTYLSMDQAPLSGLASQFEQFVNLQTLIYPDMEPTAQIGAEEFGNFDFLTGDTTSWSSTLAGGSTFAVTGTTATLTRGTDSALAYQDVATKGLVYDIEIYVETVSGTCAIVNNSGTILKVLDTAGVATLSGYFHDDVDGSILVRATTDAAAIAFSYCSVKPITTQIINGGMDAWTGVAPDDQPDSYTTFEQGDASSTVTENPSGHCQIISDGTLAGINQASVFSSGSQYRVQYDISAAASGSLKIGDNSDTSLFGIVSAIGSYLKYGTVTTELISVFREAACDITIVNILGVYWPDQAIGNISSLTGLPLTDLEITAASSIGWTEGAFDSSVLITTITFDALNWDQAEVNAMWASLVVCEAAGDPSRDATVTITNMFASTGQGITDEAALVTAGWTITAP